MKTKLLHLAQAWRSKAEAINQKYRDVAPEQAQVAVSALETCAEEIEDLVRGEYENETTNAS